jgi:hypothetical protein
MPLHRMTDLGYLLEDYGVVADAQRGYASCQTLFCDGYRREQDKRGLWNRELRFHGVEGLLSLQSLVVYMIGCCRCMDGCACLHVSFNIVSTTMKYSE